jgi:hypothetical protein
MVWLIGYVFDYTSIVEAASICYWGFLQALTGSALFESSLPPLRAASGVKMTGIRETSARACCKLCMYYCPRSDKRPVSMGSGQANLPR